MKNEAVEALLKVKKEHPEAKGKKLQTLVGMEYNHIRVKRLLDAGYSQKDIAKETKLNESTVRYIISKI